MTALRTITLYISAGGFTFLPLPASRASANRMGASAGISSSQGSLLTKGKRGPPKRRNSNSKDHSKTSHTGSSTRHRARQAIRAGDYQLAQTILQNEAKSTTLEEKDRWAMVKAELAFARKNYARAGLIAMRIVILRPKSDQVGIAFYWAGRSFEALGRSSKATELYQSCLRHKSTGRPLRQKVEKRLARMTQQSAK